MEGQPTEADDGKLKAEKAKKDMLGLIKKVPSQFRRDAAILGLTLMAGYACADTDEECIRVFIAGEEVMEAIKAALTEVDQVLLKIKASYQQKKEEGAKANG